MISIASATLTLAITVATEGAPQQRQPGAQRPAQATPALETLAQVKALFSRLDANQDAALDLAEAAKQGLAPRDVTARDANGDQKLSADEFVLAYRAQQLARGLTVATDVDTEATRIERIHAQARAATPAAPAPARPRDVAPTSGAAAPRPAPPRQPAGDPKADLEGAIDEALRRAAVEPRPERVRREPAQPAAETAPPKSEPTAQPAAETSRPRVEPPAPKDPAGAAPADALDERARAVEEALVQRLRESGASDAEIAAARERLRKRLTSARDRAATEAPEETDALPESGARPSAPAGPEQPPAATPRPRPAPASVPGERQPGATSPQPEKGPVPARPVEPPRAGATPAPGPRPSKPPKEEQKPGRPSGG